MKTKTSVAGSFRDPSGFLFYQDELIYRQVNIVYKEHYDRLIKTGLYDALAKATLLIPHEEVEIEAPGPASAYKIIKPELIDFISYPYEWCFSQFKDAAFCILQIQKKALEFGMSLKDASAYNIQFLNNKPILIDTLSLETYHEGRPWVAYRQFCQHFLAPLLLMAETDIRLSQLLRIHIDGIPLDLAAILLPFRSRFRFSTLTHIHLHAKSQRYFSDKTNNRQNVQNRKITRQSFFGLIDNLESAVRRLKWKAPDTEWEDYYQNTNYSSEAMSQKEQIVAEFLDNINPGNIWDIGANTGRFSDIATEKGIRTISIDGDPGAVEIHYLRSKNQRNKHLLPLIMDLTNPSSGIGWHHSERLSLQERGPTDTALALALIHHLAISNNLPFDKIADFFNNICNHLIIEYVPKDDSQAQRLLASREDIFEDYTQAMFEKAFGAKFEIIDVKQVVGSSRILYHMRRR